ncbi:hypothetical protein HLB23_20705 [Nocardia uniformis]|uniref:Uncharacterized protein n=1 Tax=Nocardia uniformis TaxID=53432 RepID=A0A849C766_9NOCA|nr:TAXI family TRAP transporter solute-binding subunit [Nocardia uniformis]NNH72250.1 hypothetical protein [Nocardia uniformis]
MVPRRLFTTSRDEVRFLDLVDLLDEMRAVSPVYEEGVIPAATYGLTADVKTIVVPNVLLVRDDLDANLAYVLTKAPFERKPQLVQPNPAAEGIEEANGAKSSPVESNRGAEYALK